MDYARVVESTARSLGLVDAAGLFIEFDSLMIIDLVMALEQEIGWEIPVDSLGVEVFASVDTVVQMLERTADVAPPPQVRASAPPTAIAAQKATTTADAPSQAALSYPQLALWHWQRQHPESIAWNISMAIRLRGPLDRPSFRRAVTALFERHEALRTRFNTAEPTQRVERASPPLEEIDLTREPAEARVAMARRELAERAGRPFQFDGGPLTRVTFVKLAADDHAFSLDAHHALCDGSSLVILHRDLGLLYRHFARGEATPPTSPLLYSDFAIRDHTESEGDADKSSYWKRQLADAKPAALPYDTPDRPCTGGRTVSAPVQIDERRTHMLDALAHAEKAAHFMVVLAGMSLFLARTCAQDDVCVITPFSARAHSPEFASTVGFFMNQVVLRSNVSGDPSLREMVRRARDVTAQARAHAMPFVRILGDDVFDHPLARVVLNFYPVGKPGQIWTGPTAEVFGTGYVEDAKVDMAWVSAESADSIKGELMLSANRFSAASCERMANSLTAIITAALETPDAPLSKLALS